MLLLDIAKVGKITGTPMKKSGNIFNISRRVFRKKIIPLQTDNMIKTILTMLGTQLNPAQLNLLSLLSYIDTEQEQQELQDILLDFYQKKLDQLLLQFQKDNNITQQTLDEWSNLHERTPYL